MIKETPKALKKVDRQKLQASLGETIRRLRKSAKVSQEELGKLLSLHQTAICRVESGSQNLDPSRLNKIAEYFGVRVDSLLIGKINFWEVAERFGRGLQLPDRYVERPFSRVREVAPLLRFLKEELGETGTAKFLAKFELENLSRFAPEQVIGVNCLLDLAREALKQGILSERNFGGLIKHTRAAEVHSFLHPVYESQIDPLRLLQTALLNWHHYETNFRYELEECSHNGFVLSVAPAEHMIDVEYKDADLGDFLCRYKKAYFAEFPLYIKGRALEITEKECHFRGKHRCVYKISS